MNREVLKGTGTLILCVVGLLAFLLVPLSLIDTLVGDTPLLESFLRVGKFWAVVFAAFLVAAVVLVVLLVLVNALGNVLERVSDRVRNFLLFSIVSVGVLATGSAITLLTGNPSLSNLQDLDFGKVATGIFGNLKLAGFICGAFLLARYLTRDAKAPFSYAWAIKCYLTCIVASAAFAWLAGEALGTHVEDEPSPRPSLAPEIVVDWQPSEKQRRNFGLETFLTLCIPALMGCRAGIEKKKSRKTLTEE